MKALALLVACTTAAAASWAGESTLFDPNPSHPWNRLNAALFTDAPPDLRLGGRSLAQWEQPDPLLSGPYYDDLLATLDEFLTSQADRQITVPTKRAILQSAVWAIFDQVSDTRG